MGFSAYLRSAWNFSAYLRSAWNWASREACVNGVVVL